MSCIPILQNLIILLPVRGLFGPPPYSRPPVLLPRAAADFFLVAYKAPSSSPIIRACRKSRVWQWFGFCTADSQANGGPKFSCSKSTTMPCQTRDFVQALPIIYRRFPPRFPSCRRRQPPFFAFAFAVEFLLSLLDDDHGLRPIRE